MPTKFTSDELVKIANFRFPTQMKVHTYPNDTSIHVDFHTKTNLVIAVLGYDVDSESFSISLNDWLIDYFSDFSEITSLSMKDIYKTHNWMLEILLTNYDSHNSKHLLSREELYLFRNDDKMHTTILNHLVTINKFGKHSTNYLNPFMEKQYIRIKNYLDDRTRYYGKLDAINEKLDEISLVLGNGITDPLKQVKSIILQYVGLTFHNKIT